MMMWFYTQDTRCSNLYWGKPNLVDHVKVSYHDSWLKLSIWGNSIILICDMVAHKTEYKMYMLYMNCLTLVYQPQINNNNVEQVMFGSVWRP